MGDAGMVRLLDEQRFQDGRALELLGVRLVGRIGRGLQGQRVENRRFAIARVGAVHRFHRALVRRRAGRMIEPVDSAVELLDGADVVALAWRLAALPLGRLDRGRAGFQRGLGRRIPQGIPVGHRDPPLRHRAVGVGGGRRRERLHRGQEVEGVIEREPASELLLGGRGARDREGDAAELVLRERRPSGQQDAEYGEQRDDSAHGGLPSGRVAHLLTVRAPGMSPARATRTARRRPPAAWRPSPAPPRRRSHR